VPDPAPSGSSSFFDVWIKTDHTVTTFGLLALLAAFSARMTSPFRGLRRISVSMESAGRCFRRSPGEPARNLADGLAQTYGLQPFAVLERALIFDTASIR
jgi:hypothetical protein